ncbi:hypothetical protein HDU79_006248, partial [Rhizoclosmatium sp. JEL0117]
MAYAVMTSLPPVYGLYTAIFPPLIFFFFAPSPFQNIGPYAVVSVMVSQASTSSMLWLIERNPNILLLSNTTVNGTDTFLSNGLPSSLQTDYIDIVMLITFIVGVIQFIVCILGLGTRLASLIPDCLISGFMASSGICVLVSQLKSIFGISIKQFEGAFSLILTVIEIFKNLPSTNLCALGLAIAAYVFMIVIQRVEIYVKTRLSKSESTTESPTPQKPPVAVTDVILTVILVALITMSFDLPSLYGVKTIGPIPSGFPTPIVPWALLTSLPADQASELIFQMFPDCISLALVCFVTTYSISKTFEMKVARISATSRDKPNSPPNNSQDLLALSLSTIFSSFLSSYVPCGSISRSALLANQTNVTTPVGSLVAVICVTIILLFLGSWFQSVPLSSLATIVIVALFGVLGKIRAGFSLIKEARDQGRQVIEAMKVVKSEMVDEGGVTGGEETKNIVAKSQDDTNNSQFVVCDVEEDPDAITPIKVGEEEVPEEVSSPCDRKTELYLLRLKLIGVHRDVIVWWITFVIVIVLDAGTGILVGML